MKTVVVLIIKNKTDNISDKYNYRPIFLAAIIAKVLKALLNTQYILKIHENQFGFRHDLSPESTVHDMVD